MEKTPSINGSNVLEKRSVTGPYNGRDKGHNTIVLSTVMSKNEPCVQLVSVSNSDEDDLNIEDIFD